MPPTHPNHLPPNHPKPIFQLHPTHHPTTIPYVREIYDLCQTIPDHQNRMDTYATHSLDGEAVEKYLLIVESFYESYQKSNKKKLLQLGNLSIYLN